MHSNFSDGVHRPSKLIEMAKEKKLVAVSLTDHDILDGFAEMQEAGQSQGIEVLSGVELSCEFGGRDLHVLGYGVDPDNEPFEEMLRTFRETRHKRGIKIIEKLNALGISIEPSEVIAQAGQGALGRPHIAKALVAGGHVGNTQEAFDKYIADGGPAYVPKYKMNPAEAIKHIRDGGGLAFVAHPGIFIERSNGNIDDLIAEGFDGIEVYHPTHKDEVRRRLAAIAEERGLLVSGGTDYHGFPGRDLEIGSVDVTYEIVERIKERLN
jgi:predicted metal-dependent phosphoesterase TrpH